MVEYKLFFISFLWDYESNYLLFYISGYINEEWQKKTEKKLEVKRSSYLSTKVLSMYCFWMKSIQFCV